MKAAFTPGTTFAGYRIESLVGRGGMGVVYRATDLSLERPVALKLIAPELAEDERFRARFLREPRLAASLDHPNVIPIYEAGEHDGQLYLAMRFVEGDDLRTVLDRDGKLSPERTLRVLAQVASALDAAHRRALVHRDMKPANVLLDEDDHAYLTDFGITKQLGGDSTDTGRLVGTLDYLAPEQIRGEPVDGRTDSYALGCVLYECLAGKPPFRRATEAETMWAHMQDEPPPLRGQGRLDAVLRKALAKDREEPLRELRRTDRGRAPPRSASRRPRRHAARWCRTRCTGARPRSWRPACSCSRRGCARDRRDDRRRRRAHRAARQRRSRARPHGRRHRLVHRVANAAGQRRGGRGRGLGRSTTRRTVSRIDPETKEVTKTFDAPGCPSELAVGDGRALGRDRGAGGPPQRHRQRVPASIPTRAGSRGRCGSAAMRASTAVAGAPRIAVGAGAVWAANPDGSVSRIDADDRTHRGHDRYGHLGMDDRRRRRGRLVPRTTTVHRRRPDRPAEEPGHADDPGGRQQPGRGGGGRGLRLGGGKRRGRRLADRPPAATRSSGRSTSARG